MERPARNLGLALVLVASGFTGCLGLGEDLDRQATEQPATQRAEDLITLRDEQGFEIQTRVNVVLVGFEPGTAQALDATLETEAVRHAAHSNTRDFPPGSGEPVAAEDLPVPVTPLVTYDVSRLDPDATRGFFSFVAEHPIEGEDDVYDANAAEDHLAELLPTQGIEVRDTVPTLVVLHAQDHLTGDHAWRFTYPNGHLEPVRAFGERTPLLVYDASAEEDPYVVGSDGSADVEGYNFAFEAGGNETVSILEELVIDATHYRLAKGATYPVSTKPCHKVTLLLAVHQTALTELAPGYRRVDDWVDPGRLERAFANATGDEVTAELRTLLLPQDDPALDAISRRSRGDVEDDALAELGEDERLEDALRWYLDENWERYVDSEPGCEDYLSMLLFADASSGFGSGGSGVYDVKHDRRISVSVSTDVYRVMTQDGRPGEDTIQMHGTPRASPTSSTTSSATRPDTSWACTTPTA